MQEYMEQEASREQLIRIENILAIVGDLIMARKDFRIPIPTDYIAELLNKLIGIIYGKSNYKLSNSNSFIPFNEQLFLYTEDDDILNVFTAQQILEFLIALNKAKRERNPLLLDFIKEVRIWLNKFLGRINIINGEMISEGER